MSEFIAGFVPIIVMWLLPLAPMLYAGIAAVVEAVFAQSERERPEPIAVRELST